MHNWFLLLLLPLLSLSCKKEDQSQEPPTPPSKTSPMKAPGSAPKLPTPPPKRDRTKERSKRLVEQLNRLNQCIYRAVDSLKKSLRSAKKERNQKYFHLKKLTAICEKNLMNVVLNYPDISLPYQKYCTLAAQTIDTYANALELLSLPEETPGRPPRGTIEKRLSDTYNQFALQNNDLHGVHTLVKRPKQPLSTVDVRTYGDEMARLGEKVWRLVKIWTDHHPFTKSAGKDRPSWMLYFRREIVAFTFISGALKKELDYFKTIRCVEGFASMKPSSMPPLSMASGTPKKSGTAPKKEAAKKSEGEAPSPEEKKKSRVYTCEELSAKAKMVMDSTNRFVEVWKRELKGGKRAYPVISPSFKTKTSTVHSLLKSALLVLPKRIK